MQVEYTNLLRLKYSGNGNYSVSWLGWPSEGNSRVRKRITRANNHTEAGQIGARLFCDWLETGPMGEKCKCIVSRIFIGSDSADTYHVGVQIKWEPYETESEGVE